MCNFTSFELLPVSITCFCTVYIVNGQSCINIFPQEMLRCARAWSEWELRTLKLVPDMAKIKQQLEKDEFAVAFARIEWYVPSVILIGNVFFISPFDSLLVL